MIEFKKVVKLYFEYLTDQLSAKPDRNCPGVKSIGKGICELSDLLLGKYEFPGHKVEVAA